MKLSVQHMSFSMKMASLKLIHLFLTASAPEGTSELFHTKYFDEDAFLSQSGQLYMEAAAMAHGRVFHLAQLFVQKNLKHAVI